MKQKIIQFLEKHNIVLNNQNVCIGISTGVDSTVLLHCLMSLKEELNINIISSPLSFSKEKTPQYNRSVSAVSNATLL